MIPEFQISVENNNYAFFFIIIPLIMLLHFYFLRHAKKRALKFGNFAAMKRVSGTRIISKNFTSLFFVAIIMSLAILSLMGISLWHIGDISESDYFILLDSGASMNARDVEPDRHAVAKDISTDLVKTINGAQIGFLSFGGTIDKRNSLTDKKNEIYQNIDDSKITNTGTDISLAIISAIEGLSISNKTKSIILISDGHDTVGIPLSDAIKRAQQEHIKIYAIGVGTAQGGKFVNTPDAQDLISKIDENNLKLISNSTSGSYENIGQDYNISNIIDSLSYETKKGFIETKMNNIFLIIILVLVFLNWILDNTRFRIFP